MSGNVLTCDSSDETFVIKPLRIIKAADATSMPEANDEMPIPYSYLQYDVPSNSGMKSYMPYTSITNTGTMQYRMQHEWAYTGEHGLRQVDGRYCVAIGGHFTKEIGTYFDLILENGVEIPCILADVKADKDTDPSRIMTLSNGCVSEFVVDVASLDEDARVMGDVSYCREDWRSPVKTIRIHLKGEGDEW